MLKKVFVGWLAFMLIGFFATGQSNNLRKNEEAQNRWIDSVFHRLSLDEKIGQLFMVPAYSNKGEKHFQKIRKLIKDNQVGGVIFMQGSPVRQARMTNAFQNVAGVPLMVGMDMEWGLGMRLDSTVSFPYQMTLGAIQDDQYIYKMGVEVARQMKVLGVHVNFAPVVDINTNPENPVIGYRSFGEDKAKVTAKGLAYMHGMQDNGVMAVAKHFPGHGDTSTDSHFVLPSIFHERSRLDSVEMYPFRQLINKGVGGVMVGHLNVPALAGKDNIPTTLSHKTVCEVLKEGLGFDGLVFSDALNMKGVAVGITPGELEVLAIEAGNDVLLFPDDVDTAIKQIKKALRKKRIKRSQVETSVRKILKAKYRLGLYNDEAVNIDNLKLRLNPPEALALKQALYEQAVTVISNKGGLLPFKVLDTLTFASLTVNGEGKGFHEALGKFAPMVAVDASSGKQDYQALLRKLQNFDVVITGVFGLDGKGRKKEVDDEVLQFLKDLSQKTKVVVNVFGSPYYLKGFGSFEHIVCGYEDDSMLRQIVPQLLFAALPAKGKLPISASPRILEGMGVSLKGIGRLGHALPERVGMDGEVLSEIDAMVAEAIEDKATPGCQVLVARKGKVVFEKAYGYHTYDSLQPVNEAAIYDVASVTKVVATVQSIMFLEERGIIDLDKKISHYLPELVGSNKEDMIFRDVLTHQAGLLPYIPFWKQTVAKDFSHLNNYYSYHPEEGFENPVALGLYSIDAMKDSVWQWVLKSDLRKKRYKKPYDYKYSDMGYYILQRLAEKVLNQSMGDFLFQNLYAPLGLGTMGYLPLCRFPIGRLVPTESDSLFRKTLICGWVHDQGAAMYGGVAGHAGIFSNAHDLAKLMQMHLWDGAYGGTRYYQKGTVGRFTAQQYSKNRRGLGWDKPLMGEWYGPTSEYASAKTYGHTGFTGTAVWVDPEFDLIFVFLSNRVYPDATNFKLIKNNIRTRIQDIIYKSMWAYQPTF